VRCRFAEIERFRQSGPARGTEPIAAFAEMGKRLNSIYHAIYKTTDRTLLNDLEAPCRELPHAVPATLQEPAQEGRSSIGMAIIIAGLLTYEIIHG
jgi:hypothetical protein